MIIDAARFFALAGLVAVVLVSGCTSGSLDSRYSDRDISDAIAIWVNQTGLNQDDADVWAGRLDEICAVGEEPDGLSLNDLAERYIAEDAELSVAEGGALPTVANAGASLSPIAMSPTCNQ